VLAGGGEKEVKLKRLASNLPNIEFAGKLNYNQVLDLYVKSDVGLCAYSKDATQSLPNKPFEYMASSLALLSSLPGELEEIIRKEKIGLQYKADDPKSLAEQLCYLMKNRDECEAMGERAKNLFDSCYSSDIIYPRLIGFLDTVVQENLRKR
jgi:glycosyltransferase involved in cell wall biosynthesis